MFGQAGRPDHQNRIFAGGKPAEGFQPVLNIGFAFGQDHAAGPAVDPAGGRAVGPHDTGIQGQATQLVGQTLHAVG